MEKTWELRREDPAPTLLAVKGRDSPVRYDREQAATGVESPAPTPCSLKCVLQLFHSLKFIPTLQPLGGEMSLEYAGWGGREPSHELTISTLVPSFTHCPHTFRTKQNVEVGPQDWRKKFSGLESWSSGSSSYCSWIQLPALTCRPQVTATPIQGIRIPSFGLHRHQASLWYTHTYAEKTMNYMK